MGAAGSRLAAFSFSRPSRDSAPPRSSSVTFMQSGVSLGAISVGASRRLRPPSKPSTRKVTSWAREATFGMSFPRDGAPLIRRAALLVVLAHPVELPFVFLLRLLPGGIVHLDESDRRGAGNEDGVVVVPEREVRVVVHEAGRYRAVRVLVRETTEVREPEGRRAGLERELDLPVDDGEGRWLALRRLHE